MALDEEVQSLLEEGWYHTAHGRGRALSGLVLHLAEVDALAALAEALDVEGMEALAQLVVKALRAGAYVPEPDGEHGLATVSRRCVRCGVRLDPGDRVRWDAERVHAWCLACAPEPGEPDVADWEHRITAAPEISTGPYPLPALVYHGTDGTVTRLDTDNPDERLEALGGREKALALALVDWLVAT